MTKDVKFLCPHCLQKLSTPIRMGGAKVQCPVCQNVISVPLINIHKS
jgi:hypothetical protein